jgi:hypothetical protein
MRVMVSRMTPGEMSVCRGMSAVWLPHEQARVVCGPVSFFAVHPYLRSAFSTFRSFIGLAIA